MIWLVTGSRREGCEDEVWVEWPVRAFSTEAEAVLFAAALDEQAERAAQHTEDHLRRGTPGARVAGVLRVRPVCPACDETPLVCDWGLPPAQDPEGRRRVGAHGSTEPIFYDVVPVPVGAGLGGPAGADRDVLRRPGRCVGRDAMTCPDCNYYNADSPEAPCPTCHGTGEVADRPIPPGHVGIVDPPPVPLHGPQTCDRHGPTVAVTWFSGGPDACPRCDRPDCRAAREAWERLTATADGYAPRALATPMAVSGCSLTTLCGGPPVDWRARALEAEAAQERLWEALEAFAEGDCAYGDGCPTFGSRHGECRSCKARKALEGGGE